MPDPENDDSLREMAEHRGFKLVRSRRRKPGSGDYGKYGLSDAAGKPLYGIGKNGLEASRDDIAAYLRGDAIGTWRASAQATPNRATPPGPAKPGPKSIKRPGPPAQPPPRPKPAAPKPAPKLKLVIRAAKAGDAALIMPLLRELSDQKRTEADVARNLVAMVKADAGLVIAEYGDVVGVCAFAAIATLQHGPVGRLTLLLVANAHRRAGIGSALVDAATAALGQAGCTQVEAMSGIDIKNAHGFFRALDFAQTSYRFVRAIGHNQ